MLLQRKEKFWLLLLLEMFFKKVFLALVLIVVVGFTGVNCAFAEVVDRIAAVVNNQVITLTDLRIADAFGFYKEELEEYTGDSISLILERMINQKVVIESTRERVSVPEAELQAALDKVEEKLGQEEMKKRLGDFGLDADDLKDYYREIIVYQKILSRRFGQGISVSLEEIESYYRDVYIPYQQKKGLQPKPMIQLLNEIETLIKERKIKAQVVEWINNLKKQAEIEIKLVNSKQ